MTRHVGGRGHALVPPAAPSPTLARDGRGQPDSTRKTDAMTRLDLGATEESGISGHMNAGQAIEAIKRDHCIRRSSWDVHMHVYLFTDYANAYKEPCMVLHRPDGTNHPGWMFSQEDVLAEDWELHEYFAAESVETSRS